MVTKQTHDVESGILPKKPDPKEGTQNQVKIKSSIKQGQINIAELLTSQSKSRGRTTRRGKKLTKQNIDPGSTQLNSQIKNNTNTPIEDASTKRIVDDTATPSRTTLPRKALTPETVSTSHDLMRKRTKSETAHPSIVMPKPAEINSPPRNAQMLKKLVEPVEVPKQQIPPAINDHTETETDPLTQLILDERNPFPLLLIHLRSQSNLLPLTQTIN